jgi:hypothetical protein
MGLCSAKRNVQHIRLYGGLVGVTKTSANRSVNDIEGRRVLSTVAADDVLAPVAAELQACAIAGCRIACWWRDDDAIADTPELRRLVATSEKLQLPVLLSVIPGQCEANLCVGYRRRPAWLQSRQSRARGTTKE